MKGDLCLEFFNLEFTNMPVIIKKSPIELLFLVGESCEFAKMSALLFANVTGYGNFSLFPIKYPGNASKLPG